MYGSSFHLEQSINTNRMMKTSSSSSEQNWNAVIFAFWLLARSTSSFAGPSQPRLPGGNGNVRGR